MRLLIVRHGATDWTDEGRLQGHSDFSLNARGRDQARRLRRSLEGREFAQAWSSDLRRAIQTAEILTSPYQTDRRLRELNFGELEGQLWDDLNSDTRGALVEFDRFTAPGGESTAELARRLESFLDDLSSDDHLIVTHGGVIRWLLRHLDSDRRVAPGEFVVIDWNRLKVVE